MRDGERQKLREKRGTGAGAPGANGGGGFPALEAFPGCCALVLLVPLKPRPAWVSGRSEGLKDNFCSAL
jgi:hypothetical protein